MLAYIIRRLIQSIVVLLMVIVFSFSLPYFQPEGIYTPAYSVLGTHATHANILAWGAQYGLNHPFFVRLWNYIIALLHGNFGFSYKQGQSVYSIIATNVPRTVWLALSALLLTLVIAVPLGMIQAQRRNSVFDYAGTGVAFVLYAVPSFLLAFLLIQVFAFGILHLPSQAPTALAPWAMFTNPVAFILPVAPLTLLGVAGISPFMPGAVLDVMVQDYVRTAKAKGCSARRVLWRHTFRNALGPIITLLGLAIPGLFGGALIVEDVFNYPGLGYQAYNGALNGDLPLVIGITLLVAVFTVLGNLAADLALGIVNPRIRIERSGK